MQTESAGKAQLKVSPSSRKKVQKEENQRDRDIEYN
jgi:hypothetical protein